MDVASSLVYRLVYSPLIRELVELWHDVIAKEQGSTPWRGILLALSICGFAFAPQSVLDMLEGALEDGGVGGGNLRFGSGGV